MKKLLFIAISAVSLSAYALPTYEPFTEYAAAATATGTNAIDLTTLLYAAPSPESWGALNFAGTQGTHLFGLNIDVTNVSTATSVFQQTAMPAALPSTFPGYPSAGSAITDYIVNAEQPFSYPSANYVGNSAIFKFGTDITRPSSGTKTLYVSYLYNLAQAGQLGTGNQGRYLSFVAATNLSEGFVSGAPVAGAAYTNWAAMFNTFTGGSANGVHYASHGLLGNGSSYYIGGCDSSAGKNWSTTPVTGTYGTPIFVVGEYVLNSGANKDTNIVWVNPTALGGATPPASGNHVWTMAFNMTDLGGVVFEDRVGSGASGGVGTNYIANLIVGSTWSYVTGGPEFTTQPAATTAVALGGSASLSGVAVAAAQSVTYQWVKVTGGVTNNVNNGAGGAGGSATVSGAGTASLSLTGFSAGDVGNYQLVATASGTSFALPSATAALVLADPQVTVQPAPASANYNGTATFTATVTTSNPQLTYGWSFNGTPMQNGTQPDGQTTTSSATGTTTGSSPYTITLTLNNVTYQDIGNYALLVTNNINNAGGSAPAALTVADPYFSTQPANPAATAGGNATFTVVAQGSPTFNYQWYEGANPLSDGGTTVGGTATVSGSQTATLTLTGVQDADNGSYTCQISGSPSGQTATSATAVLTVQDALTIVATPVARTERVGDHLAFTVGVLGGGASIQWYGPSSAAIPGATNSSLILTNIQTGSNGTYSVVVSNVLSAPVTNSATLTVINSTILTPNLSPANLVVSRVGDGAQTLSIATGNTIYLDQYTPGGSYVDTIQVPDEPVGSPYGTGGSQGVYGSPALLVAGAGADAGYEAMLTLSTINQEYIGFAGFCEAYPFAGANVGVGVGTYPNSFTRGLATVNAFGIYTLAATNGGLYSGGTAIRGMVTLDETNFWTVGSAGSGTVKYINSGPAGAAYASGNGDPSSTGVSAAGGRAIHIINGPLNTPSGLSTFSNLVFSETGAAGNNGLYVAVSGGTPEPGANGTIAFTPLLFTGGGQPGDFAFSPDNATIYVAESSTWTGTGPGTGGIERWDTNLSAPGWVYSYTLPAMPGGATNGAQGLTVDWSASATWGAGVTGAKVYATSYGASTNSLVMVVDNGAASTPTVLATAGPNQGFRGVSFGPAVVAPAIVTAPQPETTFPGNSASFTVAATGSGPLTYQWYQNNVLLNNGPDPLGSGATISGATTTTLTIGGTGVTIGADNNSTYKAVVANPLGGNATSASATLTVTLGSPTITPSVLLNFHQAVGDRVVWAPNINGSVPITYNWYKGANPTPIATGTINTLGPGQGALVLTNIQTTDGATYTLKVQNTFGGPIADTGGGVLTVSTIPEQLSSANLVVARIGDGVQTLSSATGNTLFLDQYTTGGSLVTTTQIPDEATGNPYGTGGASSIGSVPAMLFAGAGTDAAYEGLITLSGNQQNISLGGYCEQYPFSGPDMTVGANGGNNWRGVANFSVYGYYTLLYTNTGLFSGGNHQIHGAVDIDGNGTNWYATGQAGSSTGLKYLNVNNQPQNGGGVVAVVGTFTGTRVAQIISGNLVYTDANATPPGIYGCSGLPTTGSTSNLLLSDPSSPVDFAVSPDGMTVYLTDDATFIDNIHQAGGIQRYDGTPPNSYTFSYTLGTGTGSTVGARGLAVDWSGFTGGGASGTGAKLYATTAEASANRLITITDNGQASTATLLTSGNGNEILTGVRFGPVSVSPSFATGEPNSLTPITGQSATFSAQAVGSGPLTYQWYFQTNCSGSFAALSGATNATYNIAHAGSSNVGCYEVVATNPGGLTSTSSVVSLSLLSPPVFTSETFDASIPGFVVNFTGPAGIGYSIRSSSDITVSVTNWAVAATGTFSGGSDSFTDFSANNSIPQVYYVISVP